LGHYLTRADAAGRYRASLFVRAERAHERWAGRAGSGRTPEMMLTILRTAFLAYVRVLLCLQGTCLGFLAWALWPAGESHTQLWAPLGLALLFTFLGLAGIAAALLLRRGRRWAAIAAILIEALWAAVAAALAYKTLKDWPLDWQFLWQVTAGTALFLVTVVGLLLPPVRAYAGLVRHAPTPWTGLPPGPR
jgi:hypothetical protein